MLVFEASEQETESYATSGLPSMSPGMQNHKSLYKLISITGMRLTRSSKKRMTKLEKSDLKKRTLKNFELLINSNEH